MRIRTLAVLLAAAFVAAGFIFVGASRSQATTNAIHTARNPLTIGGSVVAGVTSVQAGQILTFDFTERNHSAAAVTVDFDYTVTHGRVLGIICPLVSTGADINPDTPFCEPGSLAGRSSTQSAIVVRAPSSAGSMTIFACADDEDNGARPNCTSVSVPDIG